MAETERSSDVGGVEGAVQALVDAHLSVEQVLALLQQVRPSRRPFARNGRAMPTVAEYLPTVLAAIESPATRSTFQPHLRALVEACGAEYLDRPNADDLRALVRAAGEAARARRPSSRHHGHGAEENARTALRFFFNAACDAGYRADNPAARVRAPRRRRNPRRALEPDELARLWHIVGSGGNDPALDLLICRFALECGARLGGLLHLRLQDLDRPSLRVLLREKLEKERWVPITAELADALATFAASRGSSGPADPVFRYRPTSGQVRGAPLTRRRLNTLFERVQAAWPEAAREGISLHWLRHYVDGSVMWPAGVFPLVSAPCRQVPAT